MLINHMRGMAKSFGKRLPACSADSFHHKVREAMPQPLQPALEPLLDTLGEMTERIRAYDRQIEDLCQSRYPETKALRQVGGVGTLTSLAYILSLEDPARFRKSRELGPFLGMVPRQNQSGGADPQLRITKTGDVYLRRLPWTVRPGQAGGQRPVHPRALRSRQCPAPLGSGAGRSWGQERQEARPGRRRSQTRGPPSPPVEDRRDLRPL